MAVVKISSGTLKINAVLVFPVEHQLSPQQPGPVGVTRERRGTAAKLSKRGASKVALDGFRAKAVYIFLRGGQLFPLPSPVFEN